MRPNAMAFIGAIGAALTLVAPSANAGFILSDYVLLPLISEAEITPPDDSSPGEVILNGAFCRFPTVYQGKPDGSFAKLIVTDDSSSQLVAELDEYETDVTYKFGVKCHHFFHWRVAEIDVTVPKTSGWEFVQNCTFPGPDLQLDAKATGELRATCPTGKRPVGGGCESFATGGAKYFLTWQNSITDTNEDDNFSGGEWRCSWINIADSTQNAPVCAEVICVDVDDPPEVD